MIPHARRSSLVAKALKSRPSPSPRLVGRFNYCVESHRAATQLALVDRHRCALKRCELAGESGPGLRDEGGHDRRGLAQGGDADGADWFVERSAGKPLHKFR